MGRLHNTLRNSSVSMFCQLATSVLSFINRTFFIYFLNVEYLGLNGLFSNILSMLSLAELGIGTAIIYKLYKPIAEKDVKKIQALMNFYKNAYQVIGIIILIIGISLIPFLDSIVGEHENIPYFSLLYLLYLLNSVSSYFFTYKRFILSADQKEYINSINRLLFVLIQNVGQFLVLVISRQFIAYLIVTIICTIASNLRISYLCDKMYPYLRNNKEHMDRSEKKDLYKYVFAQTCHQIGGVVVNGTDNILITTLVDNGLFNVGIYSNYNMILSVLKSFINSIFNATVASVGNLNVSGNLRKSKEIFNQMFFLNYLFYGFTSVCFFNLAQFFIELWIGPEFLLGKMVLLIIVINYYLSGMRQSCIIYNTTLGLFWNDRYKPLFEAAINLIASIFFIKQFGLIGVFLGTLVSNLSTNVWVEPYLLYRYGFKEKLSDYFLRHIAYTMLVVMAGYISNVVLTFFSSNTWIEWSIQAVVCSLVVLSVLLVPCCRTKEFQIIKKFIHILDK